MEQHGLGWNKKLLLPKLKHHADFLPQVHTSLTQQWAMLGFIQLRVRLWHKQEQKVENNLLRSFSVMTIVESIRVLRIKNNYSITIKPFRRKPSFLHLQMNFTLLTSHSITSTLWQEEKIKIFTYTIKHLLTIRWFMLWHFQILSTM